MPRLILAVLAGLAACSGADPEDPKSPDTKPVDTVEIDCPWPASVDPSHTIEDFEFDRCDGGQIATHDFCGAQATVVMYVFGWCIPCFGHVELADELEQQHAGALEVLVVLAEDPLGDPAEAGYCTDLREVYPVDATWVLDPEQLMGVYGVGGTVIVLGPQGEIVMNRDDATDDAIRAAVDDALRLTR